MMDCRFSPKTPDPVALRRCGRREFLVAVAAGAAGAMTHAARGQDDLDTACRRCRGMGLVPVPSAKPFVFVEGQGAFKPEAAVIGQACPMCQFGPDNAARVEQFSVEALVEQAREDHAAALKRSAQFEERMGEKLLLVQTRHAAIHTQLKPADAKGVGQAVENLALHLQKISSSLALTPTRPSSYQQAVLWGEASWQKFRQVMETIYTQEQLGENWHNAGKGTMYDHVDIAHCYLTPRIARDVPPEFFAVKLAATRQIYLATNWKAPAWLGEGFAAYGQQAVLGEARVSTIYALGRGPARAVTLAAAARHSGELRPWDKLLVRELRDFEPADYFQSLAMVAFLLESEPAKFLAYVDALKSGATSGAASAPAALAESFGKPLADLEAAGSKWLAKR